MVTVSVCMIVKNESRVLARCLDSLSGLYDELIIIDTGSTDDTKAIALTYTENVYDLQWRDDFAYARNIAFSYCTKDYIYSVDADEVLDEENRNKFLALKECLDPQIEIVQMYYANQLENGTVYNFDKELRPKLFKRKRDFVWIEPVHETIREYPLVYDSDIEIQHKPEKNHVLRDTRIFENVINRGQELSARLFEFYARELFVSGDEASFGRAEDYFTAVADAPDTDMDMLMVALCVVVKAALIREDYLKMYQYALKAVACNPPSEICCMMGAYYLMQNNLKEAAVWYYNAAFECTCILNIKYAKEYPLSQLTDIYRKMGMEEQAREYESLMV